MELNYKIDLPSKSEWYIYYAEYKYFIENSFERLESGEITVVSLPFAFCIRHTLELGYKTNIIELEKVSGIQKKISFSGKSAHRIDTLHSEFVSQVNSIFNKFKFEQSTIAEFK